MSQPSASISFFAKSFTETLLNDYFDGERTILITTHQVEEIENLLTDIMFINDGQILLNASMEALPDSYVELVTSGDNADSARKPGDRSTNAICLARKL